MKYIRTNNWIYKLKECKNKDVLCFGYGGIIAKDEVKEYRTADSIKELCDDFILHARGRSCVIGDIEAREIAADKTVTVYGAIWVEDGGGNPILKSVAKMNAKEELELL